MQASKRKMGERKMSEGLLPGIPDSVTLSKIVTKLPWRAFHISLISSAWLGAVRSHQVYAERVHSNSTETIAIVTYNRRGYGNLFALYSMRDYSLVELPPIPNFSKQIRGSFGCVSLEGKIYVLGGKLDVVDNAVGSDAVYVFDVVGLRQWKRCASMTQPRMMFGCAAMNGKIYVFGGASSGEPVCGSEVYDPKKNSWSQITPMIGLRYGNVVETVGKELLSAGGGCFDRNYFNPATNRMVERGRLLDDHLEFDEVYNPVNDEWRVLKRLGRSLPLAGQLFVVAGKLYSMNYVRKREFSVHIHDEEGNSWTLLQSFLLPEDLPDNVSLALWSVQPVDDELLAVVHFGDKDRGVSCVLQSKEFGGESKEIVWKMVQLPFLPGEVRLLGNRPCPIQL